MWLLSWKTEQGKEGDEKSADLAEVGVCLKLVAYIALSASGL